MSIYRGRNRKEFYLSSLLYDSIDDRDLSAVKSLLSDKGADPNIVLPKKGISPFHLVIGCDSNDFAVKVTRLILQYGGNPNVRSDDGLTPVHIAAAWGRLEILKLLLVSGGDPEARDSNYMTPVHYARKEEFVECLELLRSYLPVKNEALIKEKEDCENCNLVLDKIVVNNGRKIGEYEVVNEYKTDSIIKEKPLQNLQNLPQSDTTEYVMNWFNKHIQDTGGKTFIKPLKSAGSTTTEDSFGSFESSVDESENEHLKNNMQDITFRKSYRKTRKISKGNNSKGSAKIELTPNCADKTLSNGDDSSKLDISKICTTFEDAEDISFTKEFSAESGIVILSNSVRDKFISSDEKPHVSCTEKEPSLVKLQDVSSDYMTCSNNSVFEHNIFEVTEDVSANLFSSDESKSVKSMASYNAKSEGICSNDMSFVSVSEVYKYEDKDEGIVLYERRLLKTPSECNGSIKSSSFSSKLSSLPETIDYDTDTLRKELALHGYNPGPITVSTKRVYLKKLYQLKKYPNVLSNEGKLPLKRIYSVELEKTIRDSSWCSDLTLFKSLEEVVVKQFSNPDPSRKWREGVNKSSFTYLLLDPRVSNNLPCRADILKPKEIWETFLASIFYVGKGKRSRPYSHLYEAVTLWNQGRYSSSSKKIQNIVDIWKCNNGVICLHVFQNIIPVEAYSREAAMISALKIENLTNVKTGDFYGMAATWPQKQKKMFGVYLLYKAMMIFLNEGERQLCPCDID